MELVCVRHGRTAWNAGRKFQGQTDIPLDPVGLAQAEALAAHLRGESFDLAVTSDLIRAATTARAICSGRPLSLEYDPELREMGFGVWEGLTWDEILERTPGLEAASEKSPRHYTPDGGESWDALGARIDAALRRITSRLRPDGRALIVSHAGVMHAIVRSVFAGREESLGLKFVPAGIMRVHGSYEDGWELAAVNETADSAVGVRIARP